MEMKNKLLMILLFSAFISSCTRPNMTAGEYKNDFTLEIGDIEEEKSFYDEFDNFTIVPLEGCQEAMLSDVYKMQATDTGVYFFDNVSFSNPSVLLFNHDGSFRNKIGTQGHSKGEYTSVSNFSATSAGDTVVLLDFNTLKTYRSDGTFVSSQTLEDEYGWDDLLPLKDGLLMATYHRGYDHLMSLYSWGLDKKQSLLPSSSELIKGALWSINRLQKAGDKICFLDAYTSTFYVSDLNHLNEISRFALSSPNMLTEQIAMQEPDFMNKEYDFVKDYIFDGEEIFGTLQYNGLQHDFRINLNENKVTVNNHSGFNYIFLCYHDGFYYQLLSPFQIKKILGSKEKPHMKEANRILEEAFKAYNHDITEYDNYYMLKMKKREKK